MYYKVTNLVIFKKTERIKLFQANDIQMILIYDKIDSKLKAVKKLNDAFHVSKYLCNPISGHTNM